MAEPTQTLRTNRKHAAGVVSSRSGDKTIKVTCSFKIPHPLYRKEIRRETVLHVHDEQNACKIGDKVEVEETRPISKMKRWRIVRVIEAAPVIVQANV
jgi:small subunit ribosomal protein S17